MVTAKPAPFARQVISHFRLDDHFRKVYGSDLDGTNSKKSDLIGHVLDTERIAACEAVMVGDRKHDIIGAQEHGLASLAVLWGYSAQDEIDRCNPDETVHTPAELPDALNRITRR